MENVSTRQILKNILIKPSSAFSNINIKSAIIIAVFMIIIGTIFSGYVGMTIYPESEAYRQMQAQFEELEGFEEDTVTKGLIQTISTVRVILAPLLVMIGWLIKAGILNIVFSLFGAEVRFSHTLAILGLAWVPFLFRDLFQGCWMLLSGEFLSTSSLGSTLDIFVAWNAILLIIGFAVAYNLSRGKVAAVVIGYWAITVVLTIGLNNINQIFAPAGM